MKNGWVMLISAVCGLLFGAGLIVSDMANPQTVQRYSDKCSFLWLAAGIHKNELVFKIPRLAETPVSSAHFPGRKRRFRIRPRTSEIRSKSQEARCCPLRVCLHAWDEA